MELGEAKWGFELGYGIVLCSIFTVIGFSAHAGANVTQWSTQTQNMWNYIPIIFLVAVIVAIAAYGICKRHSE